MTHATLLWSHWQDLLDHFAWGFSRPGYYRFAEWITAMAINVEEHTVTQSSLAVERPFDWKPWNRSPNTAPGTRPRHSQPDWLG